MRESIDSLDRQFAEVQRTSSDFISELSTELLYASAAGGSEDTCGEQILRSAAVIEQSFGGLTANLWDDPWEWTLPETLDAPAKVLEYLAEVEDLRHRAFGAFAEDSDLSKEIMTPSGRTQILPFLLDTLNRARHHQQRAFAVFDGLTTDH